MIHPARVRVLGDRPERPGRYVLYWMQQSQRTRENFALEHAIALASSRDLPVVVGFGVTDAYPEANARHYAFMLQGLSGMRGALRERGVAFVVRRGSPPEVALELAREASVVVCDVGYLRHQRAWREQVAREAGTRVLAVEGDVVIPVERASDRREYAARTLRPKIARLRDEFLTPLRRVKPTVRPPRLVSDLDVADPMRALRELAVDRSVAPVTRFVGGEREALRRLRVFVRGRLQGYASERSEPKAWHVSELSAYLHFGQIAATEVARAVRDADAGSDEDALAYLEELVVRRELAANYVWFEPEYDRWSALPEWARRTLQKHAKDRREHVYGERELVLCATHDARWNAAMREMVHTGYMHNTLRMYWAKKILEWSELPEVAFERVLRLNNRYFLDGRDPSSYANVAWCFGLHDRPWGERPIYGTVRSMTAAGLERKFDMDGYARAVDALISARSR